jgi:hypothetical protein
MQSASHPSCKKCAVSQKAKAMATTSRRRFVVLSDEQLNEKLAASDSEESLIKLDSDVKNEVRDGALCCYK